MKNFHEGGDPSMGDGTEKGLTNNEIAALLIKDTML